MGKRRKKGRSVRNNKNQILEPNEFVEAPHAFVIHKGLTGDHLNDITRDFRKVMEPFTATALKERKKNSIKDFVAVAGLLHVSHVVIFSRTEKGMYLKVARLPRGPTLSFKLHNFTLSRDVVSNLKKQNVVEAAFKHSPLIVMNSFSGEGNHMKLMTSMFQNMFPSINLTNVDLNNVRRTVLFNYDPKTGLIDFRHYVIKIIPTGISKGVKKCIQGKVPNLKACDDISDFFTKSGALSESEFEDDGMNQVTLPQKIISRGNIESGKSSIKLVELGPRLTLQLVKIEDGLLDGEVLFHNLINKTDEETLEIQKKREAKKKLKEERKKRQAKNQEKKENLKKELKQKSLKAMNIENEVKDNDAEYYREEVGEEPDNSLFNLPDKSDRKRKMSAPKHAVKKRKKNFRER